MHPLNQRLLRLLRSFSIDVRFGGRFLGGTVPTRYPHLHAHSVANSDYGAVAETFGRTTIGRDDVIVDVGCGKGRVINYLLSRKTKNRIVGVELDPDIAQSTAHRLRRYRNVTILTGNILDLWPEDATLFYLYNPFGEDVVRSVSQRLKIHPRRFTVIYYNCVHRAIFEREGFSVEFHSRDAVPAFRKRLQDTANIHDFCLVRPPSGSNVPARTIC